jgi:hypothetical protein
VKTSNLSYLILIANKTNKRTLLTLHVSLSFDFGQVCKNENNKYAIFFIIISDKIIQFLGGLRLKVVFVPVVE